MTTNFGCCERRTMASPPSAYSEDRNLLRLRAWEQRNLGVSPAKELNAENVPLFGEPYKTKKGDELSNRIQRMLGSYEDVNNPCPFALEPLPVPPYVTSSQSDRGQPHTDNPTKPPFHYQVQHMPTHSQRAPPTSSLSSQPTRTASSSPPHPAGHSSTSSSACQKTSEAPSHVTAEMGSPSPDAKPEPFLCSGGRDDITADAVHRRHADHPPESVLNLKQSPKEGSLQQAGKGSALPSQTFPSLLSKQPSAAVTQKPTAYVRPMDGQDQVFSESPELKPSPEPYVPLPEPISKSELEKTSLFPQYLETKTSEVHCVDDILKEMTHSWPPLLAAIHTPSTGELSKSLFSAKEADHVSSGQKNDDSTRSDPSQLPQQSSSPVLEAAQSRGVESASSSDSDSSCRSESDGEGAADERHQRYVKTEPDIPSATHDWQLVNWIRSSLKNSSADGQGVKRPSESLAGKRPPAPQSSTSSGVEGEAAAAARESKPPHPELQEFCGGAGTVPQQNHHNNNDSESRKRKPACPASSSKPARADGVGTKCEEAVASPDEDPCFTDRPKVKMKPGRSKKSRDRGGAARNHRKRTQNHTSLDESKVDCPSCGGRDPNPCSCPAQSPPHPDRQSPAPPLRMSKSKSETNCKKDTKVADRTAHKPPGKAGRTSGSTREPPPPPVCLIVRIDLSLLSRVPPTSSKAKTPRRVTAPAGRGGDTPAATKRTKTSKTRLPHEVEVDASAPRKKPRLENQNTSSHTVKPEKPRKSTTGRDRKKTNKHPVPLQQPPTPKDAAKELKVRKRKPEDTPPTRKEETSENAKRKRSGGKNAEHENGSKVNVRDFQQRSKRTKNGFVVPSSSQPTKKGLTSKPEDREYPVKHYIKEAKKLKHKADAEPDKVRKALSYMDSAMYFVESGIAMEKDPQISMSSYTMFAETVELLKFVLKLKIPEDPSAPPAEKDFLALCLKCQSLLHMAMFRHKHKTALKYSKMLSDHFKNPSHKAFSPSVVTSKVDTPTPGTPSPANTSSSSGPGSNQGVGGSVVDPVCGGVTVPLAIEQVASSYVNITSLFLSAQDTWEQAEAQAHRGSGMLAELDRTVGRLNLMSSMSALVRYTRQGVQRLRQASQKTK
ncbi:AF4/FMR2 family member 1 isoform X2 [Antennarius striatus]|uniref:AF4/FMR2 family member 1 isoform X2 n=1 Tax=Antennarius striatus TaxID=241820 RepID=UPI0035ADDA06